MSGPHSRKINYVGRHVPNLLRVLDSLELVSGRHRRENAGQAAVL
jgi:hypothetical protein